MARTGVIIIIITVLFTVKPIFSEEDAQTVVQDIPIRCINNSVTKVSCKNLDSDDSLLPHPDDCELFYYCVSTDHEPICRQCPAQLHFNPIKHVCDMPEHAGCILGSSN